MTTPRPRRGREPDYSGKEYIKDSRSTLTKLLGKAPTAHEVIDFPGSGDRFGKGNKVAVVAVPVSKRLEAFSAAWDFLTQTCARPAEFLYAGVGREMYNAECQVQLLLLALRNADDPTQSWANDAQEIRDGLDSNETEYLFDAFSDWDAERSTFAKMPTLKATEELFAALGKGTASRKSLKRYDAVTLRYMLIGLAVQHAKRTTTRSSDTGRQTASSE